MSCPHAPVAAVVVAAGSGSRLGAPVPKALVELEGTSLVRRSVNALAAAGVDQIVVVIPSDAREQFEDVLGGVDTVVRLVLGGRTRQDSVRLGLAAMHGPSDTIVLVHDAARALVPPEVIGSVVEAVASGADVAVPVIPVVDSMRRVGEEGSVIVDRDLLRAVQTPQGARLQRLREAHALLHADGVEVTDDAAACEYAGGTVTVVPGHRDALKITQPEDLLLAAALLAGRDG